MKILSCLFAFSVLFAPAEAFCEQQMATIRVSNVTSEATSDVSLFKEADIKASSSSDVGDFLSQKGLSVLRQGGEGQTSSLYIRGAEAEHVLVLVDGVPLNDASNPSRSFDLSRIPLSEIRRIELIKGPQSVRYGSQALGGVLRLWTYATQDKTEYSLGGKLGNLNTSELHGGVLQPLGLGFHLGLNGQFYETQGFSAASGGREKDAHRSQSGATSLSYTAEKLRTQYAFRRVSQLTDIDSGGGESNDDPNFISRFGQDTHSLISQFFPAEDFQAQLILGHSDLERHYDNFPDLASNTSSRADYFGKQSRLELSADKQWGEELRATFGVEATEEKAHGETQASSFREAKVHKEDVFALLELKPSHWSFNVGGRLEDHSQYGSEWSSEAGVGLQLNPYQRLQLRYAQGTRWPSLFQLYDPTFGNSQLTPERSSSVELAWSHLTEKNRTAVTLFQSEYENLLDYDSVSFRTINQGEARICGVEAETTHLTGRLAHTFRYQYLHPRKRTTDTELLRRARHELYLSEAAQFSRFNASLWLRYKSKREDRDPTTFLPVELPEYWVFGLRAQYNFEAIRLWASIENLTQNAYEDVAGYRSSPRRFWLGFDMEI